MGLIEHSDSIKETLLKKIDDHKIVVGIIGLGFVGLPLAVEIAQAGFRTVGFDIKQKKVDSVNQGRNYIADVDDFCLKELVRNGMFSATTDFSCIAGLDFVVICVPTPLDPHRQPDLSRVESSARSVAQYLRKGMTVVLESTTYPGTTEEIVKPILESTGLKCGEDFWLGFSPERVDPGNEIYKTVNIPIVAGGCGDDAGELISALYGAVLGRNNVFHVSSAATAEMVKMLENTYRSVNIGLINEFAVLCDKMGIDVWEVIDAAKTKPFGFAPFYPGPGVGGHCIPVDPCYLSYKARAYGLRFSLIDASTAVNDRMPAYCVDRIADILNRRFYKSLSSSMILILGVTYKEDINDCRESPAIRIIERLVSEGAEVIFYDPYVSEFFHHGKKYEGEKRLSAELLSRADITVILTAHSNVDYEFVQRNANVIYDTRNGMRGIADRSNIELL